MDAARSTLQWRRFSWEKKDRTRELELESDVPPSRSKWTASLTTPLTPTSWEECGVGGSPGCRLE